VPSLFSKIIAGELPGHVVWQDDAIVAFLTIAPLRPGHTLVVPRQEVDNWTDADPGLLLQCTEVAQVIARAVKAAWDAPRTGLVIAGFEVPHLHLHVFPAWDMDDFDFHRVGSPSQDDLAQAAERVRQALREQGSGEHVPG
jgi:diadenosine tetraphosphate (Ap4A) HIT family hydrolase